MTGSTSMKTTVLAVSAAIFSLVATVGQAAGRDARYLEACEAELEQYYGESRQLAVINKRRTVDGIRVTLSARRDQDNAEFVNCWIPNGDGAEDFRGVSNSVAATVTPVPVIE